MASNVTLNAGSGGVNALTKAVTHDGDTAHLQGVSLVVVSGTEDSYTIYDLVGGAGAVTGGTPRVTLGSDDPAVVALQVIDDWDESDRCKVNIIAGQAGVAAGAGTVGATVQRVTLASDDPAVTDLAAIEVLLGTIDADTGGMLTSLQLIDNAIGEDGAMILPSHTMMIGGDDGNTVHTAKMLLPADDVSNATTGLITASFGFVYDGSTWDRMRGTAADGVLVNLGSNNDVTIGAALPAGGNTIGDVTISGSALTSLQLLDDAIKTDDAAFTPASDKVSMVGAFFDDVATDTVDEGDAGALRMSTRRELYVQLRDAAGNERGLNITAAGALNAVVTNAGTFVTQVDGAALTALQLLDDVVFADDATFTPGTSKVAAVGFLADEDSTDSVNEGDIGAARMTLERKVRTVAALDSAAMQSGNDQVTPKFAVISASSSGDNTLVAAVASKKIRVLSYYFTANGTVTVRFESGAGGTALSGQMDFVVNTGISCGFNPVGWFETGTNTLLNMELSGAVEVAGGLVYIEVD